MKKNKLQLEKLIAEGEEVLLMNKDILPIEPKYVPKQEFEIWMGKINTFNERHLKNHPMYTSIFECYFHRKNIPFKCNEMMGLLKSVEADDEFWSTLIDGEEHYSEEVNKMMSKRRIFISHRTSDKAVADMLSEFIVSLGINNQTIFCSSLPGNDVKQKISSEVKRAIKDSCLNIVILSKGYYESTYCLNEAGILWYNDTPVLIIALPEIQPSNMIGFLNDDYKLRRIDNEMDIAYIADLLVEVGALSKVKNEVVTSQGKKLISRFTEYTKDVKPVLNQQKLRICGIDANGRVIEHAKFQKLVIHTNKSVEKYLEEIKELYKQIEQIQLDDIAPVVKKPFNMPVEVDDGIKAVIEDMAMALCITLSRDFFFVGSLAKPFGTTNNFFGREEYIGTNDERKKYDLINKLYLKINEGGDWALFEDGFSDIMCVRLALKNEGDKPDEDIDVSLRIPKRAYRTVQELPELNEETMKYLVEDCNLYDLLRIPSTAEYNNYDTSVRTMIKDYNPSVNFWEDVDYKEKFIGELRNVFGFEVYEDGEDYVIKLKFEYLKHNTTVAFPAALILKEKLSIITYEITTKTSAEIIKDDLQIL